MRYYKVILAGGSGFIGSYLIDYFRKKSKVIVLTRSPTVSVNNIRYINWDGVHLNSWIKELENCDLLINLSGKNIKCLFTPSNKKKILESRIKSVKVLNEAIHYIKNPPRIWIQASALGFYGDTKKVCDEFSERGNTFLASVTEKWEASFFENSLNSTRKIAFRFGLGLHNSGGMLKKMVQLTNFFSGASIGNGKMYISWFHLFDLVRIIDFLVNSNEHIPNQIFNVCGPNPITNKDFMKILRDYFKKPCFFSIPNFFVKFISRNVFNIEPELILDSQKIVPKKLLDLGFRFKFDNLYKVLFDLYSKYKIVK